ncbi:hypothetical protein EIJ81_01045 (plasmid) [Aliivibrio salmonicida]|uniref:DNA cytosine methyltransferase n=1 Tax=Aliivibrio salmonicida TaxID=40269 RepID=UPI000F6BFF63|nr:DNA cytosine methyltransferase [Aliivibrio salmonicida]AZL83486.1 hypothetical protein EIJ81_01045 [Aliivibrio salmonicida]
MRLIDLFSGIGGFSIAALKADMDLVCHSEYNGYCETVLERHFGCSNTGDIRHFAMPESEHPYALSFSREQDVPALISSTRSKRVKPQKRNVGNDFVPCEYYDHEFVTLEDFYSEVLPFPECVSAGIPCQGVSASNTVTGDLGIFSNETETGLTTEYLRILEDLEPETTIFECGERLLNERGFDYICSELQRMGYKHIEWQTIAGVSLGYPQMRPRLFCVGYHEKSVHYQAGCSPFTKIKKKAHEISLLQNPWKTPLITKGCKEWFQLTVMDPSTRANRSLQINGLGNSVIPEIPELIFNDLVSLNRGGFTDKRDVSVMKSLATNISKFPRNGLIRDGLYWGGDRDKLLDPTKSALLNIGLFPTLTKKGDGNNLFSESRLRRPGGFGGIHGALSKAYGFKSGGVCVELCEMIQGYPVGYMKEPVNNKQ